MYCRQLEQPEILQRFLSDFCWDNQGHVCNREYKILQLAECASVFFEIWFEYLFLSPLLNFPLSIQYSEFKQQFHRVFLSSKQRKKWIGEKFSSLDYLLECFISNESLLLNVQLD